ncbi:hypothetical protein SAMN05421858_2393 [Haladaptatus litoreus]|uniref:Uncharacterized protein n=1 Tax=Haladaptatus litoreus TaxID=553468 RepID=A0A1N7B835_9EURY|nr:hypothetical protein [Haladaptatus litoreus]SIR47423.1 hypothetical protein SAMN05421858_2393 [Haladaptatus litoreus]
MSQFPDCGNEVKKLVKSDASAGGFLSSRNVWDCLHCGSILGVSDNR